MIDNKTAVTALKRRIVKLSAELANKNEKIKRLRYEVNQYRRGIIPVWKGIKKYNVGEESKRFVALLLSPKTKLPALMYSNIEAVAYELLSLVETRQKLKAKDKLDNLKADANTVDAMKVLLLQWLRGYTKPSLALSRRIVKELNRDGYSPQVWTIKGSPLKVSKDCSYISDGKSKLYPRGSCTNIHARKLIGYPKSPLNLTRKARPCNFYNCPIVNG